MTSKNNVFSHILYSQKKVSAKKKAKILARIARKEAQGVDVVEQSSKAIKKLFKHSKIASKHFRRIRYELQVLERILDDGKSGILRYYLERLRTLEAENQGFIQTYKDNYPRLGGKLEK